MEASPMTEQQKHCDHEEICRFFFRDSKIAVRDGTPCMRNHEGCAKCVYDSRIRPVGTPPVPDSSHLLEMAHREWKNRDSKKPSHLSVADGEMSWCSGWMAGFLSADKPDWSKEHEQWAHWTAYFLRILLDAHPELGTDENVLRWSRQTEKEKESDREWARKSFDIARDFAEYL